jgi:hypothetical protein
MNKLIAAILSGFTPCQVRRRLYKEMRRASLSPPARLSAMLRHEKPQYVAAAILAVNTRGE